jgi:hypothetical protein
VSAVGAAEELPPLRRLPVPVADPRPEFRVVGGPGSRAVVAQNGMPGGDGTAPGPGRGRAEEFCARRPTPVSELPEPRRWAAAFVVAALEVSTGRRPVSQLVRWSSDDVRAMLMHRAGLAGAARGYPSITRLRAPSPTRAQGRTRVRSIRAFEPADGVAEVSAVVVEHGRTRAVALRMEGLDGRWRVTALEIG